MRYALLLTTLILASAPLAIGCSSGETPPAVPANGTAESKPADAAKPVEMAELAAPIAKPEPASKTEETASEPAGRQWKDPAGNVLAVGEFVSLMDGNVCLETPDGRGVVVPLDKLCEAHRASVQPQPAADPPVEEEPELVVEEMIDEIASSGPAPGDDQYDHQKVVIPFDFVSSFDDGRYGSMIADMIVAKIQKQGKFVVPDAIDIRDVCNQRGVKITPDTPLPEIRRVLRDLFDAHIAIWGSCEKVAGQEWDVYDLAVKCADFSESLQPKMLYEKVNVRTKTVSEIPHLYVAEMLDKLYGREPGGPAPVDQFAEQNWLDNPSLIENGNFETGARGVPTGWEDKGGQQREPLGNLVQWTTEAGNTGNRVIRFTFDAGVGDGFGVMYYSKTFPVEEGAKYRFQCRYRTNGPKIIVFIKCYDEMGSQYKPSDLVRVASHPTSQAGGPEYVPEFGVLRECYRSQQNLKGAKNQWHTHTQDFTPRHTKYTPKYGRVMLYSYLGAGVVEFDDVVLKQIVPASASDRKKELRHSQDSSVTVKEMEENERRAREARERVNQ